MKNPIRKMADSAKRFIRYWDLLVLLVQRDVKLKYRRSFLGYIWSVLNPLLSMLVMVIVFSTMFKRSIEKYPVYLICGNILFAFMRDASTQAMHSVIDNAQLLKKANVPRYIFTLSKVTSAAVNFVFSLGALLIVMLAQHVPFQWMNLLIVVPIFELYVFCVGLGLFLGAITVFFRDVKNIWGVITLAWMYLTPIFYSLESFYQPGVENANLAMNTLGLFIRRFNPMYIYIQQFRYLIMQYSPAWEVPCGVLMWRGAIVAAAVLIVGAVTFRRTENKFILYI